MNGNEQTGATVTPARNGEYGCEIEPAGPVQDMAAIDVLAGALNDRTASPAVFTGGMGGRAASRVTGPGSTGDRMEVR